MQDTIPALGGHQGTEFEWVKPKWSRLRFELRAGDTVIATLDWARGRQALGRWGQAAYRFGQRGWLRPRVLIWSAEARDADAPLATFEARHGALTLPNGRAVLWRKPRRLTREHIWVDDAAMEIARFRPERRRTVVGTPVALDQHPDLPLLILLGQYLIVSAAQDAEAATTAAVVASVG
jgi:hypothetical protein